MQNSHVTRSAALAAIDPLYIHHALQELRSTPTSRAIFGAVGHKFVLNPVLSETEVQAFETMHRISLPADYRRFLTQVGNGGAGPYYGIFPLGQMDGNDNVKLWQENDGVRRDTLRTVFTVKRLERPRGDAPW